MIVKEIVIVLAIAYVGSAFGNWIKRDPVMVRLQHDVARSQQILEKLYED